MTIDWDKPLASEALGAVKRVETPEELTGQRFVYFHDGKFKSYFEDGTPYSGTLRKMVRYNLHNVGEE